MMETVHEINGKIIKCVYVLVSKKPQQCASTQDIT